mgnify:CR=1 FL=1
MRTIDRVIILLWMLWTAGMQAQIFNLYEANTKIMAAIQLEAAALLELKTGCCHD